MTTPTATAIAAPADDTAAWIIQFTYRPDPGPSVVGPFVSEEDAYSYLRTLRPAIRAANVLPVTLPPERAHVRVHGVRLAVPDTTPAGRPWHARVPVRGVGARELDDIDVDDLQGFLRPEDDPVQAGMARLRADADRVRAALDRLNAPPRRTGIADDVTAFLANRHKTPAPPTPVQPAEPAEPAEPADAAAAAADDPAETALAALENAVANMRLSRADHLTDTRARDLVALAHAQATTGLLAATIAAAQRPAATITINNPAAR